MSARDLAAIGRALNLLRDYIHCGGDDYDKGCLGEAQDAFAALGGLDGPAEATITTGSDQ